jgi:hypothetical protein
MNSTSISELAIQPRLLDFGIEIKMRLRFNNESPRFPRLMLNRLRDRRKGNRKNTLAI